MGVHREHEEESSLFSDYSYEEDNADDLDSKKRVRKMLEERLERKRLKEELEDELDGEFDWDELDR